nr:MAG TPA: hypothetical protein [Caudoviricetes sp.]
MITPNKRSYSQKIYGKTRLFISLLYLDMMNLIF